MGCCFNFGKNKTIEENLSDNIYSLNKITNSVLFSKYCKMKIKFILISKKKIQVEIVKHLI
jgi:hypothetical protein